MCILILPKYCFVLDLPELNAVVLLPTLDKLCIILGNIHLTIVVWELVDAFRLNMQFTFASGGVLDALFAHVGF